MSRDSSLFCAFNRVLLILLSFAILVFSVAMLLLPAFALAFAQRVAAMLQSAQGVSAADGVLAVLPGVGLIALVALIVLIVELYPWGGRRSFTVPIQDGKLEYPIAMVASGITQDLSTLDGVQEAAVRVNGHGKRVAVRARLRIAPDQDVQVVTTRAASRIREKVTGMGLELRETRIAVQTAETALRRRIEPAA